MSFKHSIGITYTTPEGAIANGVSFVLSPEEVNWDVVFATGASPKEIDTPVTQAHIQSLLLWADKDCTIKTNTASPGTDTIELSAGIPIAWNDTFTGACPITANVTKFFIAFAGTGNVTVKCRIGVDDTV